MIEKLDLTGYINQDIIVSMKINEIIDWINKRDDEIRKILKRWGNEKR